MFAKRRGTRFSIAVVLVWVLTGWFGPPAHGQTNPITNGTISVKLHTVATLPTGTTGAPIFSPPMAWPATRDCLCSGSAGRFASLTTAV